MNPDSTLLARLPWDFILHLTFPARDVGISRGRQLKAFAAYYRTVARKARVSWRRLPWVLRREKGDTFGKEHLHCLLSGLPSSWLNRHGGFALCALWESCGGRGMARFGLYDPALAGADYICKSLNWDGGKVYEFDKFGRSEEIILSHSVQGALEAIARGDGGRRLRVARNLLGVRQALSAD